MVSFQEIIRSHHRIEKFIHRSKVLTNQSLDDLTGTNLYFKCENFQKAGAFKIRGATNAVQQLSKEDIAKGVVTINTKKE